MNIIADTNIFLAVALNEPEKERIIDLTTGCSVYAPKILPFEIGNALSSVVKKGRITKEEAIEAWISTQEISVILSDINLRDALKLSFEHKCYAYDCYFLSLAMLKNYPLLSIDKGMISLARKLKITILEV